MDENVDREIEKKIIESPEQLEQQQEAQQTEQQETREQYRQRRVKEIMSEYEKDFKRMMKDFITIIIPEYGTLNGIGNAVKDTVKSSKYYSENKEAIDTYIKYKKEHKDDKQEEIAPEQQENKEKYDEYVNIQKSFFGNVLKSIPGINQVLAGTDLYSVNTKFFKNIKGNLQEMTGYSNEIRQEKMKEQEPEKMPEMEKNEKQNQNQENEMELE